jgi:hypothetical protein
MEPMVMDLMKGPSGEDAKQRLVWLKKVHFACASATEGSVSRIAEPLKAAIDLVEKLDGPGVPDDQKAGAEAQLAGHMLQAQGLALYCYLEELNKLRNAIAAEVAKQKPGSPEQKKGQQLQGAYEQAIDGLARAYNALRAGNFEEMKSIVPVMEQVRKTAQELSR